MTLPSMSDLTGEKATEPRASVIGELANPSPQKMQFGVFIPKMVVRDSAASRN